MTNFLLHLFVKDNDRSAMGRLSGLVGMVCNLLLAAVKLLVGIFAGSVAVIADGLNNLMDAASSVVTFLGFKLAERPADREHPYGHARYEYLTALAVAGLILLVGFELAQSAFEKILHPMANGLNGVMLAILGGSVLLKLWVFLFNRKLWKLTGSKALLAAALDSRNDCIATTAVVVGAVVSMVTKWQLDGYLGMAVAIFILWSGINLARETISPLLGEGASPELQALIVDYISQHPKVLGYHDLYVHDYGPGRRFASIHVEMSSREDPLVCHEILDDMERECMRSHGIQLVIHYDPVVTDDPEIGRLHRLVDDILRQFDSRITTHDFRMVKGEGHTNLIFDVVLPPDISHKQGEIRNFLDEKLDSGDMTYYTVITFDMMT